MILPPDARYRHHDGDACVSQESVFVEAACHAQAQSDNLLINLLINTLSFTVVCFASGLLKSFLERLF